MNRIVAALVVALTLVGQSLFAADEATVEFVGETFPIRLHYESAGQKKVLYRPGALPAGEVTVEAKAFHTDGYRVIVRYQQNDDEPSELMGGPQKFTLKAKDKLRVVVAAILPPPNATVVSLKGSAILVTWIFPQAIKNPEDFKGKEKWRSTAMTLADPALGGRTSVAKRLVIESLKADKEAFGNARGLDQVSVLLPVKPDGSVVDELKGVKPEELADAIERGLAALEFSWSGEMTQARQLLAK